MKIEKNWNPFILYRKLSQELNRFEELVPEIISP